MPRKVREITDLEIDEVSLVDKGANQHAKVTIAKSEDGEKEMQMEIYDEDGNLLDPESLEDGDVVYDDEGNGYLFELDTEDEYEQELEPVGKSANPFSRQSVAKTQQTSSTAESLRVELSKALTDKDRDDVIAKAFGQLDVLSKAAESAAASAERERQLRLEREYTEVAKSYNLPIEDEVLAGVLMRCAESLPTADCEIIAKCMEAASEAIFMETGSSGGGANSDVFSMVDEYANSQVSKSADKFDLTSEVFSNNPELYDEYLREQR